MCHYYCLLVFLTDFCFYPMVLPMVLLTDLSCCLQVPCVTTLPRPLDVAMATAVPSSIPEWMRRYSSATHLFVYSHSCVQYVLAEAKGYVNRLFLYLLWTVSPLPMWMNRTLVHIFGRLSRCSVICSCGVIRSEMFCNLHWNDSFRYDNCIEMIRFDTINLLCILEICYKYYSNLQKISRLLWTVFA